MPRGSTMSMSFPPFTRAVKELLIANGVVFLLYRVAARFQCHRLCGAWMLRPSRSGCLRWLSTAGSGSW